MNYWRPNFCVLVLSISTCMCMQLPRALFSKRKKWMLPSTQLLKEMTLCVHHVFPPHQPPAGSRQSGCLHRPNWRKWLSVVPGCHLLPESTPGEPGQPFTSRSCRGLPALSTQSIEFCQLQGQQSLQLCSSWLNLSVPSVWLWPKSIIFPCVWGQFPLPQICYLQL